MTVSIAFQLASKICFHYQNKLQRSTAINEEIARHIGQASYEKFCSLMHGQHNTITDVRLRKYFTKDFLQNPSDEKNCLTDREVAENYTLPTIFSVLSECISK